MWARYSADEFYQQTEREKEEERAAILQQQIEERKYLEEERKAREDYRDQFIEHSAIIHREKLMREYEEEQQEKQIKEQLLARRRDAQLAKLEALTKQVEEEKRNKFTIVQQNRAKKAALSQAPVVRFESAHDATPVGGKPKEVSSKKDSKIRSEEAKRSKTKVSKKGNPAKPSEESNSKPENSKFVSKKLPEMFRDTKVDGRRPKDDSRRHEIDRMRYDHTSPEQIVSFERDGKRRRMPSKKTDDFGISLDAASKLPLVKPDASNLFLESDDRRRKVRSLRDKRFKKQETGKLGPQTPPLPPIGIRNSWTSLNGAPSSMEEISTQTEDERNLTFKRPKSLPSKFDPPPNPSPPFDRDNSEPLHFEEETEALPEISVTPPPPPINPPSSHHRRIATPPPTFDWGVELKGADDDDVVKVKADAMKDTEEFAKKNEGIFSQLKALKRRLISSRKQKDDEDEDADRAKDKEETAKETDEENPNNNQNHHSKGEPEKPEEKPKVAFLENPTETSSEENPEENPKENHEHEQKVTFLENPKETSSEETPKEMEKHEGKPQGNKKKESKESLADQTLSPDDFKRKMSLNSGSNVDLAASNRTVLRSFLNKFSMRNKEFDD